MMARTLVRKPLAAALLAVGVLVLAACETTKGLGRDVEKAGEAIQRAVN